jgi:hypothetical protein
MHGGATSPLGFCPTARFHVRFTKSAGARTIVTEQIAGCTEGLLSPAGSSPDGLDADPVVDRVLETLLTAKISLRRLDGDVAQQELDLVKLPSGIAA